MTEKLKLCPFCGSKAELITNDENLMDFTEYELQFTVCCTWCSGNSGWYFSPEEAANAWNMRYRPMREAIIAPVICC